jgi:hypothetical protein
MSVSSSPQRERLTWYRQGISIWQADCSAISRFSRNCSPGAAWSCASSCEAEVVISAWQSSSSIWGFVDWLWWGETDVSELRPLRAYCSSPGDCVVDRGMMVSTGAGSWFVYQSSLAVTSSLLFGGPVSRDVSGACRMVEGYENLVYSSPWNLKRCRQILRHGTSGFISHTKKLRCGILSPLKIHRLGQVRNCDLLVQWQAH